MHESGMRYRRLSRKEITRRIRNAMRRKRARLINNDDVGVFRQRCVDVLLMGLWARIFRMPVPEKKKKGVYYSVSFREDHLRV